MVVLQCSSNEPTKASELCCLVFFFGRLQTPSFRMLVERRVGGRSRMVFDVSNWRRLTPNSGDLVFRRAETRAPNVATRNTDHARNVHRARHASGDPGLDRDVHKQNAYELRDGNVIIYSAREVVARDVAFMPVSGDSTDKDEFMSRCHVWRSS